MGLRIEWGPGKIEMILPTGTDLVTVLAQLDTLGGGLPHIVPSLTTCLDIPLHVVNDPSLISDVLASVGTRHDRLLDLVEEVADEEPFSDLRLLQVCGVQCFDHIISKVPPPLVHMVAQERDDAVTATFAAIQQEPTGHESTHMLPIGVGVGSLWSLTRHATSNYLGDSFGLQAPCIND